MPESLFEDLKPAHALGAAPTLLRHRLQDHALFGDEALVALIERTPRHRVHVNTMPRDATRPELWREGDLAGVPGREVLAAVARGNIWVHLKRVHEAEPAYRALLDALFGELEGAGLAPTYRRSMSILISSPGMNIAYHADVPGQCLWQVRGRKRLWVYPARAPFLETPALERIVLGRASDTALRYEPCFDEHAQVLDLAPGDMATWPRNCPHRVRNADCLNVSFTTEHWTDALRAGYAVDYANGLLRPLLAPALGGRDPSRRTAGAGFRVKFALAAAHKATRRLRPHGRPTTVDFRVDPRAPSGFVDIEPRLL